MIIKCMLLLACKSINYVRPKNKNKTKKIIVLNYDMTLSYLLRFIGTWSNHPELSNMIKKNRFGVLNDHHTNSLKSCS